MKLLSRTKALEKLSSLKNDFRAHVSERYEHRAKSCLTCETKGACCLDAHFVNVHISRLEAEAIKDALEKLPADRRAQVYQRVDAAIENYSLTREGDTFAQTYACPLFEPELGCLVHNDGKPLPCIAHACYEKKEDLPPDTLLAEQEGLVEKLDLQVYGRPEPWLPIPLALGKK
jgi:hypothetical protein